ncbi:MAG: Ig-like domain-containing protein [Tannerella sp.]|nr:Ig-like domain-containing protein [Tannerella sp.]
MDGKVRLLCGGGALLCALATACANIGSPNGGPYDVTPPRFVSSKPVPDQLDFKGKTIEVTFDELIQLDKPSEKVIITPPQLQMPVIRAEGKKVVVQLKDSLKANTTYTIDFTNSIADNNEKNVLENFSLAFATGDTIDTLQVSGYLLNAENLEPMPGITVGLHSNLSDTAFTKLPFDRTSRTDDRGHFTIRNIAAGRYHLFALDDKDRNYRFNQPQEAIAFDDSLIIPTSEPAFRQDTTWRDSLTIDTIKRVGYTRFLPDKLVLRLFTEDFVRQYALRPERSIPQRFTLRFNAPLDSLPQPKPLNFVPKDSAWYLAQWGAGHSSVNYWLTDSDQWKLDTLRFSVTYPASDSSGVLRPKTDTLAITVKEASSERRREHKREEGEKVPLPALGMKISASGTINTYDTVNISFEQPVPVLPKDSFHLEIKVDTVWKPADFRFFPDSLDALTYHILRKWTYGDSYRLRLDSAALTSLYGLHNKAVDQEFSIKKKDEYGHLYINIHPEDSIPRFVELLNAQDAPVFTAPVKKGGVLFMDIPAGKYYARLIEDRNGNGRWDTGDYAADRQPETVYYDPKVLEVMKNWEVEETWNLHEAPIFKQKPLEITKNKPTEIKKTKRDYRNEGKNQSSGNKNVFGGMQF